MADAISSDFERETRSLTARLEALTEAGPPIFGRIGVARRVFTARGILAQDKLGE